METYRDNDNKFVLLRKILQNQSTLGTSIQSLIASVQPSAGLNTAPDIIVTVPGTAVQGSNVATPKGVRLTARLENAGSMYAGGPNVTNDLGGRRGQEITQAGGCELLVSNLNQVYLNADNAGDRVGVVIL